MHPQEKKLPIVFFHKGDSWYLKYTLKQARFYHPDSDVYLIGDESNSHYDFVTHVNLNKYEELTRNFRGLYEHRNNSTLIEYELFCFLRWFYVLGLARECQWEEFIYLDSDVLVFENFGNVKTLFDSFRIANTGVTVGVPAFTFFKSLQTIEDFCKYLISSYSEQVLMRRLAMWWDDFQARKNTGGICDMTLFDFFFKDYPAETGKLDKIGLLGFDNSIATLTGYENNGMIKNIYWKNRLPHFKWISSGEMIRFVNIHYQGSYKCLIPGHYQAGGFWLHRVIDMFKVRFIPGARYWLRRVRRGL